MRPDLLKPGFHIVVSVVPVVSVVRKKFIGQIQLYGNLSHKCSMQKKRQTQLAVRDRMNSIGPMNFFRTTDTTDTTIWKPGLRTPKPEANFEALKKARNSFRFTRSAARELNLSHKCCHFSQSQAMFS